jgi:hypothetical protein
MFQYLRIIGDDGDRIDGLISVHYAIINGIYLKL